MDKRSGQGTQVYMRKSDKGYVRAGTYVGDWLDNEKHNQGRFEYENGDVYEGGWLNGEKSGKGQYRFADGSVFEGPFERNMMHGRGILYFPNGDQLTGQWIDDNLNGTAVFYDRQRNEERDEEWKSGDRITVSSWRPCNAVKKTPRFIVATSSELEEVDISLH